MQQDTKMKKNYTGLFMCGALLAGSLTTSCTSMDDRSLVKVEAIGIGALGGAAVGAGVGAAAGAIVGDNKKDVAAGAMIGGGVGLIGGLFVGNSWGDRVVAQKDAFKSTIDWHKAHIAELNALANKVDETNASIQAKIKTGKVSAACYKNTCKDIASLNKKIDTDIANAKNSGAAKSGDVSSRIAALTSKRNRLQRSLNQLGSIVEKA